MIINVPLNKLHLSHLNVRKTEPDAEIESLADDIAARGLKQNLVVVETEEFKGVYEVVAGGRRFQALKLLVERKALAKSHPIPVLVEAREHGHETSLAENLHRVAMNPADEFEAFATVIANYENDGLSDPIERIANCAKRFGATVRHVEQRLRLAHLAPEILDALRDGTITLDAAKAYAAYPDHGLQMKVFNSEEKRGYGEKHAAANVRVAMKGKVYRLSDRQVKYVGLDAYLAAGGRVERELFMAAEDEDVLLDTKILDRLCAEKAAPEADRLAQERGFAAGAVMTWVGAYDNWPKTPAGYHLSQYGASRLDTERRPNAVEISRIAPDGTSLETTPHVFIKTEQVQAGNNYKPETAEEREARLREEAITLRAARLAVPRFAGTPFEGRAFWPADEWNIRQLSSRDEGFVLVTVQIRVPLDDVEAAKAEAAELFDRERAEQEAKAAALEAGDDADGEGDFEDDDEGEELAA